MWENIRVRLENLYKPRPGSVLIILALVSYVGIAFLAPCDLNSCKTFSACEDLKSSGGRVGSFGSEGESPGSVDAKDKESGGRIAPAEEKSLGLMLRLVVDVSKSVDHESVKKTVKGILQQLRTGDCLSFIFYAEKPKPQGEDALFMRVEERLGNDEIEKYIEQLNRARKAFRGDFTDFVLLLPYLNDRIVDFSCIGDTSPDSTGVSDNVDGREFADHRDRNLVTLILSDFAHDSSDRSARNNLEILQSFSRDLYRQTLKYSTSGSADLAVFNLTVAIEVPGDIPPRVRDLKEEFVSKLREMSGVDYYRYYEIDPYGSFVEALREEYVISIQRDDSNPNHRVKGGEIKLGFRTRSNYPFLDVPVNFIVEGDASGPPKTQPLRIKPGEEVHVRSFGSLENAPDILYVSLEPEDRDRFKILISDTKTRSGHTIRFPLLESEGESYVQYKVVDPTAVRYFSPGKHAHVRAKFRNLTNDTVCVGQTESHGSGARVLGKVRVDPSGLEWVESSICIKLDGKAPWSGNPRIESFNLGLAYYPLSEDQRERPALVSRAVEGDEFDVNYVLPDIRRYNIQRVMDLFFVDRSYCYLGFLFLALAVIQYFGSSVVVEHYYKISPVQIWLLQLAVAGLVVSSFCVYFSYDVLVGIRYSNFEFLNRVLIAVSMGIFAVEFIKVFVICRHRMFLRLKEILERDAVSEVDPGGGGEVDPGGGGEVDPGGGGEVDPGGGGEVDPGGGGEGDPGGGGEGDLGGVGKFAPEVSSMTNVRALVVGFSLPVESAISVAIIVLELLAIPSIP